MNAWSNLQESLEAVRKVTDLKPQLAVVLGSGLGNFVNQIEVQAAIPYSKIPHFSATTVVGHKGEMLIGPLREAQNQSPVLLFAGRNHFYEGHSADSVIHPVRLARLLGVENLLLTNSAGGLSESMQPGDFMIIEDHMNLTGTNPLIGPNVEQLGPRFPDMTEAYDRRLTKILSEALATVPVRVHRGVYACLTGPVYETPAEVRYLQMLGASAVGMSTAWETIAAVHCGMKVAAVSCISNLAAGIAKHKLSHEEVTATGQSVAQDFGSGIHAFIQRVLV